MPGTRAGKPQLRLALPPRPFEEVQPAGADEAPFFRPKSRTRIKRARRGLFGRVLMALQVGTLGALVVSALWTGYARVMASEKLRVTQVLVRGQRFLSEGEVRQLMGPALGENILTVDLDALKRRLRGSPWVADASVRRTLPDTLQVQIQERVPLALAEVDRLYLMDGDGTLIDVFGPRTASFDLPIVRGLAGFDGEARRGRAERAGVLLRDLGDYAQALSEVTVEDSGDLRIVMRGRGEVLRLGAPPYRKKFLTFLALRKDLVERCPNAEYFDLRFRDRIYAKEPLARPEPENAAQKAEVKKPAAPAQVPGRAPQPMPEKALPGIETTTRG